MEFFNKKEDVIDLELTPYGKSLFSRGDFKPEYYAFFDDEILYDGKYAGLTQEKQNEIKKRIKEVPRLKTQYLFTNTDLKSMQFELDIPPGVWEVVKHIGDEYADLVLEELQATPEAAAKIGTMNYSQEKYIKQYALPLPLGNCSFDGDKAPAWDIKLLYNNLDSSVSYFSASMHPHLKIPQLDVTVLYKTQARSLNDPIETSIDNKNKSENLRLKEFDELHENPPMYEDGYLDFQEDFIVLEINEHNVPFSKENFDIEVYEIENDDTKYELLYNQKYFTKKPSVVDDKGLLKSEEAALKSSEEDLELKLLPLNQSYVEHFFNVYIDHEIEKDLMCQLNPNVKQKGSFVSDPLDCLKDKEVNILSSDIYKEVEETIPECD